MRGSRRGRRGGRESPVAFAVKKIIGEIATRFNDMFPLLYVLTSSRHSNNGSSIATVEQHTSPPRKKYATSQEKTQT
jgi:hypothetical protein